MEWREKGAQLVPLSPLLVVELEVVELEQGQNKEKEGGEKAREVGGRGTQKQHHNSKTGSVTRGVVQLEMK